MKQKLMPILPHIVAVVLFAAISMAFYQPVLEGYALKQGDIENYLGMSKELRDYRDMNGEEALWTNSLFSGMPAFQISVYHSMNLLKQVEKVYSLFLPRPINFMFLAMLGFYILLLCMRVNPWVAIPVSIAYGLATIHILFTGAGHTAKVKAIAYMAPVLGSVLLTLRGRLLAGSALTALFLGLHLNANHLQMTYYLLILLLIVGIAEAIRLIMEKKHIFLLKAAGMLILGAVIGILPSSSNLLTTYEYSQNTTRGESELTIDPRGEPRTDQEGLAPSYMLEYNMARGEFWSFWIPDIKGGFSSYIGNDREVLKNVDRDYREAISQQSRYWGSQSFTGGAFYFGAAVVFLFLLGMFFMKDNALRFSMLIVTLLAVMLSWKEPNGIGEFFMDSVPMYTKFRDTKMILVLVMLIMPFIAALFIDELIKKKIALKNLLIGSGGLALLLIILISTPSTFFDFIAPAEQAQFTDILGQEGIDSRQESYIYGIIDSLKEVRQEIFRADAVRSLIITLIAAILVILLAMKKLSYKIALPALGLLFMIDLWTVNRRYLDNDNLKRNPRWVEAWEYMHPFSPSSADMNILNNEQSQDSGLADAIAEAEESLDVPQGRKDKEFRERMINEAAFRTLNFASNYRVLNLNNPFNDAVTSFWHKSIGGYHGAKLKRYQEIIDFHLSEEMQQFAGAAQEGGVMEAFSKFKVLNMLNTKYVIYSPDQAPLFNPLAQGNAWFVNDVRYVPDADTEIQELALVDLNTTALVDERYERTLVESNGADSAATIELLSYSPNELVYESRSDNGGFAVFSEIYYPSGWTATIDGEEELIVRTNYLLRGMQIPAGKHQIVFRFDSPNFAFGSILSLIGSLLVFVLLLIALLPSLKAAKQQWMQ